MTEAFIQGRTAQLPGRFQTREQLGAGLKLWPARGREPIEVLAQGGGELGAR
jgi:hypothetical protein